MINIKLLQERLAQFESQEWEDFRKALNYLVDSATPLNREHFMNSKFVKNNKTAETPANDINNNTNTNIKQHKSTTTKQ
eukprot:UN07877